MHTKSDRRQFLKFGTGAASILALSNPFTKALAASCGLTPSQTPGPFYPGEAQFKQNTDLTQIPGHLLRAQGQIIYLKGKVMDVGCKPISKANVEIWQACAMFPILNCMGLSPYV